MFSWLWNVGGGDHDSSLSDSNDAAWIPFRDNHHDSEASATTTSPWVSFASNETPGTLAYFQACRNHVESQLTYPSPALPSLWTDTLESYQAAYTSWQQAQKLVKELQRHKDDPNTTREQIQQAQQAVKQAQATVYECQETLCLIGESILSASPTPRTHDDKEKEEDEDGDLPSIPEFTSTDYNDSAWATFMVLQNPQHWASWCCPDDPDIPHPMRTNLATQFLADVAWQRLVLQSGNGPRGGNYGGYLDIWHQLDSSSAAQEPVLGRLAHAVALEFAHHDLCYFDSHEPINAVARYLHYEQAYLMGDLDPAFSTFDIQELRLAVNSSSRDWELQWGRECLQTYRPDWALTQDVQWRYCRLVRLDVGYTDVQWTSKPKTMDQILSSGGKCGPRAWFGRFICQAFGIPIWGVRQPGHAAMSRWTEQGWMICLGASFAHSWWEGRCGLDFELETKARRALPSAAAYRQQVMRLEWVANYLKESNKSILSDCRYDPMAPWFALSVVQRHLLAKTLPQVESMYQGSGQFPRSTRIVPKILHVQATVPQSKGLAIFRNGNICIPADSTITSPSAKIIVMPSFTGGRQLFLGKDATLDYKLEPQWLPTVPRTYRLTVKVATAHRKDTGLLVTVIPENGLGQAVGDTYRVPLPYTKGLWGETEDVDITLSSASAMIRIQREQQEKYGTTIKEIRLARC